MRSSSRWWALAVVVQLVVGSAPPIVHAGEPTTADKDAAREAFAEGKELRAKKKYAASLLKFKAAYALVPSPITAIEVGRALLAVGQLVEAREILLTAAAMPTKADESSTAKVARVEAGALAEDLRGRIPSLSIKVAGSVAGVSVVVDGKVISEPPARVDVNPGKHQVVAKLAGSGDQTIDVEIEEGESREVVLKFGASGADAKDGGDTPIGGGTSPLTYVGFGIAGAGVIVGSVWGVMAIGKRTGPDGEDSYKSTAMISTVGFVAAGVGATIGVIGLLTGGRSEPVAAAGATLRPWISLGAAGVTGAF
jgi:hypothetical protein